MLAMVIKFTGSASERPVPSQLFFCTVVPVVVAMPITGVSLTQANMTCCYLTNAAVAVHYRTLILTPTPPGIWLPISNACAKAELNWYYQYGVSEMFPDRWEHFIAPIPIAERDQMMAAYHRRLTGDNEAEKLACAKAWSQWEGSTISLLPAPDRVEDFGGDHFALAFARIENHFFMNAGWLEEGQLLRDAHKLAGIPGVIVHGRYDMPCPLRTAWHLSKQWTDAELHIVEAAGHTMGEPEILRQLVAATDGFAD